MKHPTVARLRELLSCDPATGALTWLASRGRVACGANAGSCHANGYIVVSVDGVGIGAHRIVWALTQGEWPTRLIDHINGTRSDNRLANLREADHAANAQNRSGPAAHNKTGLLGARFHKGANRFYSTITRNGKTQHLGYFDTAELAHAAYTAAKGVIA